MFSLINMRDVWDELTEEFVGPAVERLSRCQVFVFLVVLHRTEVSQSPHEASKVHLILTEMHDRERDTHIFKLIFYSTVVGTLLQTSLDSCFTMFLQTCPQESFLIIESTVRIKHSEPNQP